MTVDPTAGPEPTGEVMGGPEPDELRTDIMGGPERPARTLRRAPR